MERKTLWQYHFIIRGLKNAVTSSLFGSVIFGCVVLAAAFIIAGPNRIQETPEDVVVLQTSRVVTDPLPQSGEPRATTFIAVGDIMLSRTVADKLRQHGFDYAFEKMAETLRSADFAFGNLETAITDGPRIESGQMVFRADPGVEMALKNANFEILSLANNHTPNFGQPGLRDTFDYLSQAEITSVGAGVNSSEARRPGLIERNGIRLAFLAYNDTDVVPDTYAAGENRAGTTFMDIEPMKRDVAAAKELADLVIVSMHSGTEYTPRPNSRQTEFAHAAIDAGAELVIGHHPHVVQTLEEYQGKLIIYSLGNFIFDQMWSLETRQGMTAQITVSSKKVTGVKFVPILIDDYAQPRTVMEEEGQGILNRLGSAVALSADGFWRPPDE